MSKKTNNQTAKVNWPITILLIIGCLTVFFPLYMAVIIAFKQPSEMTNDIAGALAFPKTWSFANFSEAMKVTDFWHSLGNSLLLTIVTVILAILIHSLAGYAIGRSMANKKFYNFAYLYIVSGMFVPFAILMMPLVKQTAQIGIANRFGVIVLYVVFFMPMNILLYSGYLKNIPLALEEAARVDGATTWSTYWNIIFPIMKPMVCFPVHRVSISFTITVRSSTGKLKNCFNIGTVFALHTSFTSGYLLTTSPMTAQ